MQLEIINTTFGFFFRFLVFYSHTGITSIFFFIFLLLIISIMAFSTNILLYGYMQEAKDPFEKAVLDGRQLALKVSNVILIYQKLPICLTHQKIIFHV